MHLRSMIIIGLFTGTLYYAAGLTLRASVVFALCLRIAMLWITGLVAVADFKPYKLIIGVNFPAMLADFGLLRGVDQWVALRSDLYGAAETRDINQFVVFIAITPAIFARSDERKYSSNLWIHENIREIEIGWSPGPGSRLGKNPCFFFRPAKVGYQFGIQVDPTWWANEGIHKVQLLSLRELKPESDGCLVLGVLPYGYFPDHIRQWDEPVRLFSTWDRKQRRWKNQLAALGWQVSDDWPQRIEHRYVGIGQYGV